MPSAGHTRTMALPLHTTSPRERVSSVSLKGSSTSVTQTHTHHLHACVHTYTDFSINFGNPLNTSTNWYTLFTLMSFLHVQCNACKLVLKLESCCQALWYMAVAQVLPVRELDKDSARQSMYRKVKYMNFKIMTWDKAHRRRDSRLLTSSVSIWNISRTC